jgi:hypothetical protein
VHSESCNGTKGFFFFQANTGVYRSVFHALVSIVKNEGLLKLYRGATPTSFRAAVVAAAELGSYDILKTR